MKMASVVLMGVIACIWRCLAEAKAVDPPDNVTVSDLGLLGQLVIKWSRPVSLQNMTNCVIRYQLEYFNTYKNQWRGYRTMRTSFQAQFDLEQVIHVKLNTMLKGTCTGGIERSSPTLELTWPPQLTGSELSRVQNFNCVFYMKEYMNCTWDKGPAQPQQSQLFLYYWHNGLGNVAECPKYIQSSGLRTGCTFPREAVKEFTDFNVCVNGSSPVASIRPAYFSLQAQNHVKPGPVEAMSLEVLEEGEELILDWRPPEGHIPTHCLEYEVISDHMNHDGTEWMMVNVTEETSLVLPVSQRSCARVRSRVHGYCSDKSFWSDWSPRHCTPDYEIAAIQEKDVSPAMDIMLICVLLASAVAVISLCITLGMFRQTWRKRAEQKVSHSPLFWDNQHLKPATAFSCS